jgi:hypothetical protein
MLALIDVRRVGVASPVAEVMVVLRRARYTVKRLRGACRRCAWVATAAGMLRECGDGCDESYCQDS